MDLPATQSQRPNGAGNAPPRRGGRLFRKYFVLILALVTAALLVPSSISLWFSYRETLDTLHALQHEKAVAAAEGVPLADLHAASAALVSGLGERGSAAHANAPRDRTHFNAAGARAMAELLAGLLPEAEPALREWIRP